MRLRANVLYFFAGTLCNIICMRTFIMNNIFYKQCVQKRKRIHTPPENFFFSLSYAVLIKGCRSSDHDIQLDDASLSPRFHFCGPDL